MNYRMALPGREVISFGPFKLIVAERLLLKQGVPLAIGGRALDILITLISQANKTVHKRELVAAAWPDVVVEEGSLRFHVAKLREALGHREAGGEYISTVPGRGYCFVAATSRTVESAEGHVQEIDAAPDLPAPLTRMVGRADDLQAISAQLVARRFLTIVGPGGVGKTRLAVQVGHDLLEAFGRAVIFVDLGALNCPTLVPTTIAAMLRLSVRSEDPAPNLIAFLRDKRALLVLDNCEHLIDAVALLAEQIVKAAPQVHILATSREALRAEGEQVHRLAPLATPPDELCLTAKAALMFPAIQLFVERAGACGAQVGLSDEDAPVVAGICRKLDGIPLAIELAARRVAEYGLPQTAALLDERLSLAWSGQRTAQPRHQTLQDMLDWSYDRLNETERAVLRRLSVFVGNFTLGAARKVAKGPEIDEAQVTVAIASLVEKSLIAVVWNGAEIHYRLLETTRAYAIVRAGDEAIEMSWRHADYFRRWLEEVAAKSGGFSSDAGRAADIADLGNVRAALDWCFGPAGDRELGLALASAAVPAFLAMSLLAECRRWSARALQELTDNTRGSRWEMHLQAALGLSLMFTSGNRETVGDAFNRSLEVAEALGDVVNQVQLMGRLHIYHERIGDFVAALNYAQRSATLAKGLACPVAVATAHSLLGVSNHLVGRHEIARLELEAALNVATPDAEHVSTIYFGFDHRNRARITLARTLWLQGFPVQAIATAQRAVDEAGRLDHPVTLCIALIWAVSVYVWVGDYDSAEQSIDRIIAHAESHSLTPYLAVGRGMKGELAVRRGDPVRGVRALEECLAALHDARYELLTTVFNLALVEGLTVAGRFNEAVALINETLRSVQSNGDLFHLPELLRVKARALLCGPRPLVDEASACLDASLEWSRRQGALAWELRAATDLADLWARGGREEAASSLLAPVFARFDEGFDTADLQAAARSLRALGVEPGPR